MASPQLARVSLGTLYLSSDGGQNWQELDVLPQINRSSYLISVARNPLKPAQIALGTSFEGIYESEDEGKTWKFLSESRYFSPLYQGGGFYDEVLGLAYATDGTDDLFFKIAYNGKAYRFVRKTKKLSEIDPFRQDFSWLPPEFRFVFDYDNPLPGSGISLPKPSGPLPPGFKQPGHYPEDFNVLDVEREKRRQIASNRTGLYLNPSQASSKTLGAHLDFVVKNGMNSIVVDFKDDQGFLTYDTKVEEAVVNKAVLKRFDAPALIKAAHDKGIYVIARIVVFKDKQLYRYDKNSYAVWDKYANKAWGVYRQETIKAEKPGEADRTETVQTEYWVDPYSNFVHDYNLKIAKEAQDLGVDEIQFDYIRFPSDGNTASMLFRHHKDSEGKVILEDKMSSRVEALAAFLKKARAQIGLPIGTDVFGFNSWARMSYLGQDIQALSYYVDVISPMNYPSHYARDFLGAMNYFPRSSYIYEEGTKRARLITNNRVIIRPYVQAFLIGGELQFSDPQIYDYLNRQVRGSLKAGASGFTLWNNSGRYYMVETKSFLESLKSGIK